MRPKLTTAQLKAVQEYRPLKSYTKFMKLWNNYLIHWCPLIIFYSIIIFLIGLFFGENLFILFKINFYIGYFIGIIFLLLLTHEECHRKKTYKKVGLSRKDFLKALIMINYVDYLQEK